MNKSPSIRALKKAGLPTVVRAIWLAKSVEEIVALCPKVERFIDQCFSVPTIRRIKRNAIDIALENFGIEYLGVHKRSGDTVYYSNAGDTYNTTAIFRRESLTIGCWGDLIERGIVIAP